jgi:hypothetical protein
MQGVWKCILTHCANSSDFEEEITHIGREPVFDGLENDSVQELVNSHSEELSDDGLILLAQQRAVDEADSDAEEQDQDNIQVEEFTIKEFEDIF